MHRNVLTIAALAALALAAPASAQEPPPAPVEPVIPPVAPQPQPDPLPACPAPTVSIDGGAVFTASPLVTLTITGCGPFRVANDGSFNPSSEFNQGSIQWLLTDSGPERLPKIVYVRFPDGQVLTDDVILDTRPPVIESVSIAPTATAAATKTYRVGRLRIRARDNVSGVRRVEARKFGRTKYRVRAFDKAGNRSAWKIVKPRKR